MRSNVSQYDLVAPSSLDAVLQILADSPDHYTPIAGGTEITSGRSYKADVQHAFLL